MISGCTPRGKMVAGGVATTAGVVLIAHRADAHCTPPDSVCDAVIAEPLNLAADAFTTGLGIGLVALGATLLVSGVTDHKPHAEAHAALPLSPTLPPPPPAMDRNKLEDRLAMQASRTARSGNCAAAVTTANQLAARDAELHAQLLTHDDNLATCYALERATSQDVTR